MMVYISYEEPRRSPLRIVLIILTVLLALALLAAAGVGAVSWLDNNGVLAPAGAAAPSSTPAPTRVSPLSPERAPANALPLSQAVASLYQANHGASVSATANDNTNTVFLVDVGHSVADDSILDWLKRSLLDVLLPHINPGIGDAPENSRVALMTFSDSTEIVRPLASLDDNAEQEGWLNDVGGLAVGGDGESIYNAIAEAYLLLVRENDQTRGNAIVVLTDGAADETGRAELVALLADSPVPNLKVHIIGVGAEADHASLQALAQATGGAHIYATK